MPVAEKVSGGEVYLRGIDERVSTGDRVDVNKAFADYLADRPDFRIVDGSADDAEDASADEDDSSDGFDVDAWLDQDYTERVDHVRDGDVDEHLDVIDEEETSDTVRDAIGERRAELEE